MTRRALWRLSGAASFLIAAVTCTTGVDPVAVATVVVNPPNDSVRVAAEQRVTVQVFDRNNNLVTGRKITFRSNEPAIATVDSNGVVRGVAVGTVLIVATVEGKSGQASFKVIAAVDRVAIAPLTADVSLGASRQLAANVLDRSGNAIPGRLVIWSSSNSGVATVSTAGLVSAVSLGRATITATSDGKSGTATIDVVDPVASVRITPVGPQTLRVGGRVQLTATPFNAAGQQLGPRPTTWVSSNPNVASVTASGEVTAISVGQATITAEIESRQAQAPVSVTLIPVSSVTLTPSSLAMFRGDARQLTLTATDSTGATITNFQGRTVSFQSSNLPVASVSGQGVVFAADSGSAVITATVDGVNSNSVSVTVQLVPVANVTVTPNPLSIKIGNTQQFTATLRDANGNILFGRPVTWTSSDTSKATITAAGVLSALAQGAVTITATSEGVSGTASVTIIP